MTERNRRIVERFITEGLLRVGSRGRQDRRTGHEPEPGVGVGPMRSQGLPDDHRAVHDLSRMCLRFAMNCVFALRTIGPITGDASLIAGGKRRSTVLRTARRRPRP